MTDTSRKEPPAREASLNANNLLDALAGPIAKATGGGNNLGFVWMPGSN
jgi:hypothetical protein